MSNSPSRLKKLNCALHNIRQGQPATHFPDLVLDSVKDLFEHCHVAFLQFDNTVKRFHIAAAHEYSPTILRDQEERLNNESLGMQIISDGPNLLVDPKEKHPYLPWLSNARSSMAVPLNGHKKIMGALVVESINHHFEEEDLALLEAFGEQVAWALRLHLTIAQAEERANRLDLLHQTAKALNTVHDIDQLLTRILELAEKALGFQNVAILVADKEQQYLEVRKALRSRETEGMKIPIGQGITGAVFQSGRPEVFADVTLDPRYISGGVEDAHSEMVAPLRINGDIIGVLDAEAADVNAFTPLDLELFGAFASHVANALHNAQLVQDLEDRANKLQQVIRSGQALNTILNADEILNEILEAAAEALGLKRLAILILDYDRRELIVHAARGYQQVLGNRIPLGTGITGHVAQSGTPELIAEVSKDSRYIPGIENGASEMAVPLSVYGELFGVLDAESPTPAAFTPKHLELFQAFANQAAVALNNARLFRRLETANDRLKHNVEEMSRLNRELEAYSLQIARSNTNLECQIKQLTMLHQAGQTITSSLNLNDTLHAILEMSAEIVASSSGAIKLIDEETKEMRVMAHSGICENSGTIRRYDLPLKIGNRTIGVFELVRLANNQLGDNEKRMLETLASQAAIAIENARLFEDTQRVYYDTLKSLARALEARDDYTRGHSERVAEIAMAIGRDLDLDEKTCHMIFNSALLHDIGKIGIRDDVLLKPRQLSAAETEIIRKHPSFGNSILGPLKFLGEVSRLVKHHHERWDGLGYPSGLKGNDIPLESRIIAVADTYDAITSSRPYRKARSHHEAINEIMHVSGTQLDPLVVKSFLRVIERHNESVVMAS